MSSPTSGSIDTACVSSISSMLSGRDKDTGNLHPPASDRLCFDGRSVALGKSETEQKKIQNNSDFHKAAELAERSVTVEFKPFQSIESSDSKVYIDKILKHNPELSESRFVVTEKIDGSNITVMITAGGIEYFSRVKKISLDQAGFAGIEKLSDYLGDFEKIRKSLADRCCSSISIRGELYGSNINRRIDYGDETRYAAFIIEIDGKSLPYSEFSRFMSEMSFQKLASVPVLSSGISLSEALAFNVETQPSCCPGAGQSKTKLVKNIEGVVIQPCDRLVTMHNKNGTEKTFPFLLKKKAKKYLEIEHKGARSGKVKKESKPLGQEEQRILDYINKNRLITVFTHQGWIQSSDQIGTYVNWLVDDAEKDFLKNYPDVNLSKAARKAALSCAAQLLRTDYPQLFLKDKSLLVGLNQPAP